MIKSVLLSYVFVSGLLPLFGAAEPQSPASDTPVQLTVPAGVPLRLYTTGRVPMRPAQRVKAKLIEPIYAFDRIVIPAGADVLGEVSELKPVGRWVRAQAVVNGDFTPLHVAFVRFHTVVLPDGRPLALSTDASRGLRSLYLPPRPPAHPKKTANQTSPTPSTGVRANLKQQAIDQVKGQVTAKTRGLSDLVRSPNKREWLVDFLMAKLPYHPQWYRRGTRFDATLEAPLDFGAVRMGLSTLAALGTAPAPDSLAHVRLLRSVSSGDAQVGEPVEGILSEPVFSPEHQLVLPEGTRLRGAVQQVRPSRWFHRGGQLRFSFDQIMPLTNVPSIRPLAAAPPPSPVAQLIGAETESKAGAKVKVDEEGTAKATESKKRLLGPALALLVAARAADNDAGRHAGTSGSGGAEANYGGRAAGGFSGFGLLGSLASRGSHTVGTVLGYYGLGWSVYSTVISRGQEVEFRQNTPLTVRFGPKVPVAPATTKHPGGLVPR